MKTVYLIGILVFLLVTVSSASAAQTFYLTKTNEGVANIKINVTVDGQYIYVTDESPALTGLNNVDIKTIGLCLKKEDVKNVRDIGTSNSGEWSYGEANGFYNKAGFGTFNTSCTKAAQNKNIKTRGPILITLDPSIQLPKNELGNSVIVHLGFGEDIYTVGGNQVDSTWVTNQIPEFPTMALPVAAILGLMFIFGRRRKE